MLFLPIGIAAEVVHLNELPERTKRTWERGSYSFHIMEFVSYHRIRFTLCPRDMKDMNPNVGPAEVPRPGFVSPRV